METKIKPRTTKNIAHTNQELPMQTKIKPRIAETKHGLTKKSWDKLWFYQAQGKWEMNCQM